MTRILSVFLAGTFLALSPVLADESGKSKMDTVQPDGTKVSVKKKKDIKDDGSGEVKSEVKTENSATGVDTSKRTKVTREKNDDGSMTTKTRTESETETKK